MKSTAKITGCFRFGGMALIFFLLTPTYSIDGETWTLTGSMTNARRGHTATLLANGKVLVGGGRDDFQNLASAELYDLSTGTWTATGSMSGPRVGHTATLLLDGRVLVAGGQGQTLPLPPIIPTTSAEVYDPATETWTPTGSMQVPRYDHVAVLLQDGKVLIAGGDVDGASTTTSAAEIYDPATGIFTLTGSMNTARSGPKAVLLLDGRVLVAGGGSLASAEVYDPATGMWTAVGSMSISRGGSFTATLLQSGKVLVAGGTGIPGEFSIGSAELFDPASGTFALTGSLNTARQGLTATLLLNGQVLAAGGRLGGFALTSAELYNPATGTWAVTASMGTARLAHSATLLPNGQVLVAGGVGVGTGHLASAELFGPSILSVAIDIKPGSFPNSINLGSGGTVPVAILSSATFDATTVDPVTVTLGSAPVKLKGKGTPMASFEDVNGDGLQDIVVHVSTEALQLSETDTEAVLEGKTFGGTEIRGADSVRIVP